MTEERRKVFPLTDEQYINAPDEARGMDLRDHFAGLAMQALLNAAESQFLTDPDTEHGYNDSDIANQAYEIADEMMEARK